MYKKFVWLLDVDDVINASKPSKAGWHEKPHFGIAYDQGVGWKMKWSPTLIKRIWNVYHQPNVEILWATSWCGQTGQLEQLFKLPAFNSAGYSRLSIDMKTAAALDVFKSGSKLIWTDDQAVPESGLLYDTLTDNNQSLLIRPRINRGLSPEHLDQIDNFVIGSR